MGAATVCFGWTRCNFGLVSYKDSAGVGTAMSKIDADCGATSTASVSSNESTYQTDKTSLTGADTALAMVVSDTKIAPSQSNPGF